MEHVWNSIPLVHDFPIEMISTHNRNVINVVDSIFRSAFSSQIGEMPGGHRRKECTGLVYIHFIVNQKDN